MNKKEVERLSEEYFNRTVDLLGESKYHNCTPYLVVEYSPQSEGIDDEWHGEYVPEENEIIIYSRNIIQQKYKIYLGQNQSQRTFNVFG